MSRRIVRPIDDGDLLLNIIGPEHIPTHCGQAMLISSAQGSRVTTGI
jgi:hypothetical protein